MPTNDELRAMAERLEGPAEYEMTAVLLSDAAAMLRSILAEMEDKFIPAVFEHYEGGHTEILLEDCPAYTGKRIEAQLLFRMSDRAIIGASFRTRDIDSTPLDTMEKDAS